MAKPWCRLVRAIHRDDGVGSIRLAIGAVGGGRGAELARSGHSALCRGQYPGLARLADAGAPRALRLFIAICLAVTLFSTIRYAHTAVKYMLLPLAASILLMLDTYGELRGWARAVGRAAWGCRSP